MSHVDLGFVENCENWEVESRLFPSKVGGKPAWLDLEYLPKIDDLRCSKCGKVMIFLCQVYAPIEDDDRNFHRTIFVFVCRNAECCQRNSADNLKVFRCSLTRANKFYPFDPPIEGPDESFSIKKFTTICNLCGILAEKHCSQCKSVTYCDRDHQILDWKENHKLECKSDNKTNKPSNSLFPQFELVIEPEEINNKPTDETQELQLFKKLESEGKTGTLTNIPESELDAHATSDTDKTFSKFKKTVAENPDQVLRYEKGGKPLWIAADPKPVDIPNCDYCGSERHFEFQIMPQMLTMLKENDLDWGIIAIYTCSKNCTDPPTYKTEFVYKQDVTLINL